MSEYAPFLQGFVGAERDRDRRDLNALSKVGGMLNIQQSREALAKAAREELLAQETDPLKLRQLRLAIENAEAISRLRQEAMGGGQPGQQNGPAIPQFGEGGVSLPGGGQGNLNTGQVIPQAQGGQGAYGINPQIRAMLMSGDPGLMATAKAMLEQNKPIATREGGGIFNPGSQSWMLPPQPKTEAGISYDPATRQASPVAGYGPAIAGIEGARQEAQERARAGYDLVTRPPISPGQPPTYERRLDLLGGGRTPQGGGPVPQPGAMQIPREVQAARDAQGRNIDSGRTPNGMGPAIPTASVIAGSAPPNAAGMSPNATSTQAAAAAAELAAARSKAEMEGKRQYNMGGMKDALDAAERILTKGSPTASMVGSAVDWVSTIPGYAPKGSAEADQLRAIGGALTAKVPRMEGPQSDKDVQLYREMAGQIGDSSLPASRRLAALNIVKTLWAKYEGLNNTGGASGGFANNDPLGIR